MTGTMSRFPLVGRIGGAEKGEGGWVGERCATHSVAAAAPLPAVVPFP